MYSRRLELDGDDMTALLGLLKTSHQTGDLDPDNATAVDLLEELDHMKGQGSLDSIREIYLV